MRVLAVAIIAGALLASAALAQTDPPAEQPRFTPQWDTPARASRNFPSRAIEEGRTGHAVLCCGPGEERGLSCRVTSESPRSYGFGDSALGFVRGHRLTPESDAAFHASPPNWIEITVTYTMQRRMRVGGVSVDDTGICPVGGA